MSEPGGVGLQATHRLSSAKEFRLILLRGRGDAESSWIRLITDQQNTPWNQTRLLPKDRWDVCAFVCFPFLTIYMACVSVHVSVCVDNRWAVKKSAN